MRPMVTIEDKADSFSAAAKECRRMADVSANETEKRALTAVAKHRERLAQLHKGDE